MNFEEWLEAVSKGVRMPNGEENLDVAEKMNSFIFEDFEEEDSRSPKLHRNST
jgi:hypothetical protein